MWKAELLNSRRKLTLTTILNKYIKIHVTNISHEYRHKNSKSNVSQKENTIIQCTGRTLKTNKLQLIILKE